MPMTSTERSRKAREKQRNELISLHRIVAKLSSQVKELRAIVADALRTKSITSKPRQPPLQKKPSAWQPNEAHFTLGLTLGLQREAVLDQAECYRDWLVNAKHPHKNLDAGFRNWLKRHATGNKGHKNGEIPPTLSELRNRRDREILFRIVEAAEQGRTRH